MSWVTRGQLVIAALMGCLAVANGWLAGTFYEQGDKTRMVLYLGLGAAWGIMAAFQGHISGLIDSKRKGGGV